MFWWAATVKLGVVGDQMVGVSKFRSPGSELSVSLRPKVLFSVEKQPHDQETFTLLPSFTSVQAGLQIRGSYNIPG